VCCDYPSRGRNGYTSATPRDRVPRHVARLVVDYFAYAVRPGASAHRTTRRADHHAAHRAARHRLLPRVRVPRLVARLVTPHVVDYFAYAARLGASARRAARHRLLRLHRASGCLGTSRGLSCGSSSTTSLMPRIQVPRHLARHLAQLVMRLVALLVVDYFDYAARPGASARRVTRHAARRAACRRLLRAPQLRLAAILALLQPRHASRLLVSWQHRLYFEYAARRRNIVFRSHRVDHSSRLVLQTSRERQSHPQQLVRINSD
jgi:hypothetical protein